MLGTSLVDQNLQQNKSRDNSVSLYVLGARNHSEPT